MFKRDNLYKRSKIHKKYGGNPYRGIVPLPDRDCIFIFTKNDNQKVYEDKWEGNYFHYSGEGLRGDMQMTRGNKALQEHLENDQKVYLFESTNLRGIWRYVDEVELVKTRNLKRPDIDGHNRKTYQFVLREV